VAGGKMIIDYKTVLEKELIPQNLLQERIAELATQIDKDYVDANGELLLVCVLRGGVLFLVDLMRKLTIPHMIDFMSVSSYGVGKRSSSGQARISLDLNTDIRDRHVLIVEDIIDSGHTLESVLDMLSTRKPKSLEVCTLLDKFDRREVDVQLKYVGFTIPNKFVFGYGLDLDDFYRNLPFIGVVDESKYRSG
jgi:hypoxanthine phosphoribosyltransferase